jgi:hypothetical protein
MLSNSDSTLKFYGENSFNYYQKKVKKMSAWIIYFFFLVTQVLLVISIPSVAEWVAF